MLGSGDVGAFCDHHGGNGLCLSIRLNLTPVTQLLKEPPPSLVVQDTRRPVHIRNFSSPGHRPTSSERQPLIRRRSFEEYDINPEDGIPGVPLAGGTVLGIHNLAIVVPQFIVRVSETA
jgi:solute carrier family 45 protein 1/2/4